MTFTSTQFTAAACDLRNKLNLLIESESGFLPYCDDYGDGCADGWTERVDEFVVSVKTLVSLLGRKLA